MRHLFQFALFLVSAVAVGLSGCASAPQRNTDTRCYEMRIYYSPAGRLDDLHARFRDHTMKLFEKHGIQNIGYWVPIHNTENKLVYIVAYPSRAARDKSWKEFASDPEWKAVQKQSEANGRIVTNVVQIFMQPTDYSPLLKTGNVSGDGVFEWRTYTTPAGVLPNLDERFRDYTMKLFKQHGMHNWAYFHKMPDQKDADRTLIYFLTHKSEDAGKASFAAFRADPKWVAAKADSESKAAGPLTIKDGVKSVFLVPTDYSPTK